MNKKTLPLIFLILLLPLSAADFFGGSGTSEDPYEIATCEHLQNIENDLDAHYEIITNIDCQETNEWNDGAGFIPIGQGSGGGSSGFTGSLDGNFYEIRGLHIEIQDVNQHGNGMFAELNSGGQIENINMYDADMVGSRHFGAFVGRHEGGEIRQAHLVESELVLPEEWSPSGSDEFGGVVGFNTGGNIYESSVINTSVRNPTGDDSGAFVGDHNSGGGEIHASLARNSEIECGYSCGALVGELDGSNSVHNSYAWGVEVTANTGGGGALVGRVDNSNTEIFNSYAADAEIEAEEEGGLYATTGTDPQTVETSYYEEDLPGSPKGTPLSTEEMTGSDAEDNMDFDFVNTWETTDRFPELSEIVFGTREPEYSQSGDDRYPDDGSTITEGFVDLGITVSHPDDRAMNVIFRDEERGELATRRVDEGQVSGSSSQTVEARISGLQDGEEYNWYVRICDDGDDCVEAETWYFDVDYSGALGLRDKDYHPQGANIALDEEDPLYEGYIIRVDDNSSQLQPGMENTYFNMDGQGSDPNRLHLYAGFIDNPAELDGADGDHPLWYDSLSQADRADQYAIAENPTWSIGATGNPYPPGDAAADDSDFTGDTTDLGTYIHPGVSTVRDLRTSPEEDTLEKPAVVMGNSYAAVAAQDFGGHQEGDGVWIDPDNIKKFDEYYMGDWEDKLHFEMDLTGPDAGLGFDSDIYRPNFDEDNPIPDGEYYYPSTSHEENSIVVGDIYWQRENELDGEPTSETHGYLNPDMCGDDQSEYLVEEIGAINNSLRFNGSYACAETNQVCYDSGPATSEQNIFEQGAYHDTRDWTEYVGRLHNDQEKCERVIYNDFDPVEPYGTDIQSLQDDRFPGWYDQDFAEEIDGRQLCRENSFYDDRGKRWIDEDYVADHPLAVYNGINDDWNLYLEQKWGNTLNPIESRTNQLDQFTGSSSWVEDKISPVDTGTNRSYQATLGFCLGDDDGEYLLTQQSETPQIPNNNDFKGAGSNPDQCVLDGQDLLESRDDVDEIRSDDIHETIDDENVAQEERIVYNEGDIVVLDFGGSEAEVACFEGTWFSDWPIVFEEDLVQVPFEDERTTAFTLVNPTGQDIVYDVEMETNTDASVTGAGLDSFTELASEEGTEFNTTVESQDSQTFRINIRGGNEEIDESGNNYISVSASDQAEEIQGEDSVDVDVTDSVREEGAGRAEEVPGLTPVNILIILIVSVLMFYRKQV